MCFACQGFVYGGLSNLALYGFFVLSGYLFFRTFRIDNAGEKLKSRVRTLLIPYLIWQTADYWVMAMLTNLPFIANRINTEPYSLRLLDYAKSLIVPESIFWYLNYLIVFVAVSPLLYYLIKNRCLSVAYIIAIGVLMALIGESRIVYSLGCYSVGGILSIHIDRMSIENRNTKKAILRLISGVAILITSGLLFFDVVNGVFIIPLRFVVNIVGVVSLWIFIDSFSHNVTATKLLQNSFFIYCAHGVIVTIVKKIMYSIVGFNAGLMIAAWIITFAITLALVYALDIIIKTISPRLFLIVCGGR